MLTVTRPIEFRRCSATDEEILGHLQACSDHFIPCLAERVDLNRYAEKLTQHASTYEAWSGEQLVGLVAAYLNTLQGRKIAFVSNVSVVSEFARRGIATRLLQIFHDELRKSEFACVELEVSSANERASRIYLRLGYVEVDQQGDRRLMRFELENKDGQ